MFKNATALAAATVVVCLARVADAQVAREHAIVVDLTATPNFIVAVTSSDLTCAVNGSASRAEQQSFKEQLDEACRPGGTGDMEQLRQRVACLRPRSSTRWESARGDRLLVYTFFRGESPSVDFQEEARQTRLATDISTLLKVATAVAGTKEALGPPALECRSSIYALQRSRAKLKVSVAQTVSAPSAATGGGTSEAGPPAAAPAQAKTRENKTEMILTTGPKEHWFLSADAPVRRMNELKFDSASATLKPAKAPARFYVSVDYSIGDLQRDADRPHSFWSDIVFKGLALASKTPLESIGLGVGLRGKYIVDLDAVSPFAGYFWTRADPSEQAAETRRAVGTFQVGVSLNLDQAIGWLKGDGAK